MKNNTKALDEYYHTLADLRSKYVTNEEGLRQALKGLPRAFFKKCTKSS